MKKTAYINEPVPESFHRHKTPFFPHFPISNRLTMFHHQQGIAAGDHLDQANPTMRIRHGNSDGYERRIGRYYEKIENSRGIDLSLQAHTKDESGISSPPLWGNSPTTSPRTKASTFQQNLSPTSRSLAIAESRREMMEMMQDVPESAYELSLKDIVEVPLTRAVWQSHLVDQRSSTSEDAEEEGRMKTKVMRTKCKGYKKQDSSSGSMANGPFLLKMVFPASLGKKSNRGGKCSKVSPKPTPSPVNVEGEKGDKSVDDEWCNKRFPATEETENSSQSSSSVGTNGSTGRSRFFVWNPLKKKSEGMYYPLGTGMVFSSDCWFA